MTPTGADAGDAPDQADSTEQADQVQASHDEAVS